VPGLSCEIKIGRKRFMNINEILDRYDLDALIEVVDDRVRDYSENVYPMHEAKTEDDQESYYRYGYGRDLEKALHLLKELKEYKEKH
jgi:hypothetical protein